MYLAMSALQTVPLGDCSWGHLFGEKGDATTSSHPWERLFASVSEVSFQMPPFLKWLSVLFTPRTLCKTPITLGTREPQVNEM